MCCPIVGAHCNRLSDFSDAHRRSVLRFSLARSAWLSLFILSSSVVIATPPAGSLEVVKAWSRATAPGAAVGVAYFEIVNSGKQDALVRVEAPVAHQAQLHSMAMIGGVMQMREIPSVEVPAHGTVRFEPGGLHVMLIDLVRPLKKGNRFPLILVFEHAGTVHTEVIVQDLGTMTPPGEKGTGDDHHP